MVLITNNDISDTIEALDTIVTDDEGEAVIANITNMLKLLKLNIDDYLTLKKLQYEEAMALNQTLTDISEHANERILDEWQQN